MRKTEQSRSAVYNSPATELDGGHTEDYLRSILDEIRDETEALHAAGPMREQVARALRGFRLMDMAALAAGFIGAWLLTFAVNTLLLGRTDLVGLMEDGFLKICQSFLVGAGVIVWFTHKGHYRMRFPFWSETRLVLEAIGFAMLIDVCFRFVIKQDFSRLWLMSGWVLTAVFALLFRSLWRARMRRLGLWRVPTLIIGGGAVAQDTRESLASEPGLGFDVVAQIGDLPEAFEKVGSSWQRLCSAYQANYVVVALDGDELSVAEQPLAQLMREDVPFSVSPPLRYVPVMGMVPQYFFNHDVMLLTHNHGLNQRLPRLMKRAFDIAASSTALLLLSPALLAVGLILQLDGGKILFGHKRLGLNGKAFPCLKFRSMVVDSDAVLKKYLANNSRAREEWQRFHKLQNDPRVTRIGRFLRRTSIDELPQLINVLKGDMSLVGPRPIIVAEMAKYDNDISHYYRVRPGITGLWQVSGRSDVSYAERVRLDRWYVCNWSLWHDIVIICKTIPVVLKREGAY